jgi:hypothetical protein
MKFAITTRSWWDEQTMETTALPANQWVHVAMTLRGNTGTLYVNGVPQIAGYIFKNPSELYADGNAAQRNFIGRSQWPDPTFNGLVDDFRIYRHALSAAEIATLVSNVPVAGQNNQPTDRKTTPRSPWARNPFARGEDSGSSAIR